MFTELYRTLSASLPLSLIVVLLFAHWTADFVCQTDWQAINKSKRWDALTAHVAVYTLALGAVALFWYVSVTPDDSALPFALWLGVNAAAHFVQDAITSRINARLWFIDLQIPNK